MINKVCVEPHYIDPFRFFDEPPETSKDKEKENFAIRITEVGEAVFSSLSDRATLLNHLCPGYTADPTYALSLLLPYEVQNLIGNFERLGFTLHERLAFCKELLENINGLAAAALANDFGMLKLQEATVSDRLDLCMQIAARGYDAATALVQNFDKLGLGLPERIELCKMIASLDVYSAGHLIENFDKLGIEGASVSERLALANLAAGQGELAASALTEKFKQFGVFEAKVSERLAMCRKIAAQGDWAAESLVWKLENLELGFSGYLDLCREIAVQGPMAATALIRALNSILLFTFDPCERRQILFEALIPPHQITSGLKDFDIMSEVEVQVSILLTKEKDFRDADLEAFETCLLGNKKLEVLRPIYEAIKSRGNESFRLIQWAAYCAGVLNDLSVDQIEAIQETGILKMIFEHRNPINRFIFVRQLSLISPEDLRKKNPATNESEKSWERISRVLLSRMKESGFTDEIVEKLLLQIRQIAGFKDTIRFNHLIQFMLILIREGPYEKEEINALDTVLSKVLSRRGSKKMTKEQKGRKKEIECISDDLQTLTNILVIFGKEEFFACLGFNIDFHSYFLEKFRSLFPIENIQDFGARYQETFGSFRNSGALFTYLTAVKKLPLNEKERVLKVLTAYVNAVIGRTFPAVRYDKEINPHLKFLFEKRENLEMIWRSNLESEKMDGICLSASPIENYKEFFTQKLIVDKHLNPDFFPQLTGYLSGGVKETKLEEATGESKEKFQTLAIDLCEGRISGEEFIQELRKLKMPLGEFENDIKSLLSKEGSNEYDILESDDPCDLLLLGTEVDGSCQRINGDPNLNKCLASYLMNGEIKAIVVKKEDKLVARSVMRVMWDDQNQSLVLLLERVYSNVEKSLVENAILTMAKRKAERMGVSLVSREVGEGEPYQGTVKFFGGYAPFVYSDALGGSYNGPFQVERCRLLFKTD